MVAYKGTHAALPGRLRRIASASCVELQAAFSRPVTAILVCLFAALTTLGFTIGRYLQLYMRITVSKASQRRTRIREWQMLGFARWEMR
jgi:hypothetical protein